MPPQITYVPINRSHVGKALPLLSALRDAGAIPRILCLDAVQIRPHHVLGQIQGTGFGYDVLPQGDYRPHAHWFVCAMQRRRLARSLEAFLRTSRSDVFLLSDDRLVPTRVLGRSLVAVGVPYVLIADGLQPPLKPSFRSTLRYRASVLARRAMYGWGPRGTGGAHRVLVMTKTCKKVLEGCGIAAERIIVVGSPEYDRLAASRARADDDRAARSIRERLALPGDRPIVFYAHQEISGRAATENLVWTLTEACRRSGASLLVKFHPHASEDPGGWRALARCRGLDSSTVAFFKSECTSVEAVQACSVCVTAFSTVSLEAMICRRPVVLLQYLPVRETLTFARDYGAALDVNRREELEEALRLALQDAGVRQRLLAKASIALREELHGLDGRSLQRTVEAILELGERPGPGPARTFR